MRRRTAERMAALSTVIAVLAIVQVLVAPIGHAQGFVPITGSGSTWSFNALDQWRRNVDNLYGIQVQFAPTGSSAGREDFKTGQVDFAVSEIEYGLTDGGKEDKPPGQPFAYMPIVAGGTAFMYNLKVGNNRVTNLRLSGEVIAKIFTKQITNWSDPQIKADNPGLTLPARPIVPVVRSDGSGTSAQFTRWLAARHGPIWDAYCGRANCGFTSNFPTRPGVESRGQSQGVAGYVAQPSSEGAITYVEYSYAKNAGFPVAKVLNDGGYYVEPKATSVAVALTQAQLRADLTQELKPVYNFTDPRAYPLSSYSYMILPTAPTARFNTDKGRTLSEFAYYFLCEGQQQADALGYSPLPYNLVQAGVRQVARIPGTTNKLDANNIRGCRNPTFTADGSGNALAQTAPQPEACDKKGPTQCTTGTAGAQRQTPNNTGATNTGTNNTGASNTGTNNTGASNTGTNNTGAGNTGAGNTAVTDPTTGLPVDGAAIDPATGESINTVDGARASNVSAIPVQVDLPDGRQRMLLTTLAVILLGALILAPPPGVQDAEPAARWIMKLILARVVLAVAMLLLATVATESLAAAEPADSAETVSGEGEFKDLKVTVSQTKNLINQTVKISWTGGVPTPVGAIKRDFLQIMQCWGGDSGPDRRQCQFGATSTSGIDSRQITSGFGADPLEPLEQNTFVNNVPFWAAGQPEPPALIKASSNPFLDAQITNEIPVARTRPDQTGEEFFEVQTQRQSAGLDCGAPVRGGATVTGQSCWLVIVPRGGTEVDGTTSGTLVSSPLSPTNWNQRIQIRLEFLPTTQACPIGAAERPVLGHEAAADAVGRWQRALCADGTVFSYTQLTDDVARRQLIEGSSPSLVMMNDPVPPDQVLPDRPLVYAPVALSGLAIAFNVERQNFQSVTDRNGERFEEMNLTPRLVAKLLTQSYRDSVAGARLDEKYLQDNPASLTRDPEFLKYNPGYRNRDLANRPSQPIVQLGTADTTALLWSWIYGDAEARAFLAGTKDEWGMAVNPANKGLDAPPSNYLRNDQSCYKTTLLGGPSGPVPAQVCTSDIFPFVNDMHEAGRDAGRGISLTRAPETVDSFGVIKFSKPGPYAPGSRSSLAVVDTATAARYGMPTAKLRHASPKLGDEGPFVAPTTESMLAGLAAMKPGGVPGVLMPDPLTTDSAAYPLTALSHAATAPALLDQATGKDYAKFLRFVADQGQQPGLGPGQLPTGYVPLPESLRAQTRAAAATIEAQAGNKTPEDPSTPGPDRATTTLPADTVSLTPADSAATTTTTGGPVAAPPGTTTTTGGPAAGRTPAANVPVGRVTETRRTPALPAPAVGALLVALLVCGGAAAVLAPLTRYAGVTRRIDTGEGGDATDRTAPRSLLSRLTVRPALFARRR